MTPEYKTHRKANERIRYLRKVGNLLLITLEIIHDDDLILNSFREFIALYSDSYETYFTKIAVRNRKNVQFDTLFLPRTTEHL